MYESYTIDRLLESKNCEIRKPKYVENGILKESEEVIKLANDLKLDKHPNGGYFKETDRSSGVNDSSLIHFLMTCESPIGKFHKNANSRTIHILQKGKGVYILVYPDGRIKSFRVGFDLENGEIIQWVVPPNVYKGCYLITDKDSSLETADDCLLVSEVVVPGFQFEDMVPITKEEMSQITNKAFTDSVEWLI